MSQTDHYAIRERVEAVAKALLDKGVSVIPISTDTKIPMVNWSEYTTSAMPYSAWPDKPCNIALITGETNGVVVIDCDDMDKAVAWLANRTPTPLRVKSPRGMHFYYRWPGQYVKSNSHIECDGLHYDCKADKSYVLISPSVRGGKQYTILPCTGNLHGRWLPPNALPVFDTRWRPETAHSVDDWNDGHIKDVRAYISKITAIEGKGGDKQTYRVCAKLRCSGVERTEAMALLAEWNQTNAMPPWPMNELCRKLKWVYDEKT